jgi:hypothetical protein
MHGEPFLIKSAAVPPASLGTITIPFRGREIKRAGDRTFTDWSISVLCDDKMAFIKSLWIGQRRSSISKTDTIEAGMHSTLWRVDCYSRKIMLGILTEVYSSRLLAN